MAGAYNSEAAIALMIMLLRVVRPLSGQKIGGVI
jgi:hypothetical protein